MTAVAPQYHRMPVAALGLTRLTPVPVWGVLTITFYMLQYIFTRFEYCFIEIRSTSLAECIGGIDHINRFGSSYVPADQTTLWGPRS